MKRLTVDQTWEQCLAMWKWISRRCKGEGEDWCSKNVSLLKVKWLTLNGYRLGEIENDCFFCEYDTLREDSCISCPTKEIDETFHCMNTENYYGTRPRLFYAKIKKFNKIRLARK